MQARKSLDKNYNESYILEIKMHLSNKYNIDSNNIESLISRFKLILDDDPEYVFHYDAEYWADYIAESSGLVNDMVCV